MYRCGNKTPLHGVHIGNFRGCVSVCVSASVCRVFMKHYSRYILQLGISIEKIPNVVCVCVCARACVRACVCVCVPQDLVPSLQSSVSWHPPLH